MKAETKGDITRAKVITKAKDLIHRQGLNATSISHIIEATGVKKGNLYFHFPNKEALSTAILERTRQETAEFLETSLTGTSPLEKLSNYLDAVFLKHKRTGFVGGCLIGNSAIETGDNNPALAQVVSAIFDHWKQTLAAIITQARDDGCINPETDPEQTALHMIAAIEGGIMIAKVSKKETDLMACLDSLRAILGITRKPGEQPAGTVPGDPD